MFAKCILIILSLNTVLCEHFSVTSSDGNYMLHKGISKGWIAQAIFTDNVFKDGWSYLEIETNSKYPDIMQSFAAGYLEGGISKDIIYNSWRNTQEGFCKWKGQKYCEELLSFLKTNILWMKSQIETNRSSPIWHQVESILTQLKGLSEGYNEHADSSKQIEFEDFYLMNLSGDLEDLDNVFSPSKQSMTFSEWVNSTEHFGDGHCSALIKVLPGNSDILASHVTWNTFQSMLRIQKKYKMPLRTTSMEKAPLIPGYVATFSSYPTYLSSGDDFNLLSSGLLTMETTIGNSNPELWHYVKPEGELPEWIRGIIANRLATNGEEWSKIFTQYNSGTYNNQWMVLDYKLFKPGKPIKPKTLFVLEQIPGNIKYGDKSDVLLSQTYWPSYNTPSYKEIFNLSGGPALVKKYGDWFSYERTPRALIFKRDQDKVKDMKSLFKLMRYNDFRHDPLSRCNCTPPYSAENAISARNDLNPKNGHYPFGALGHRPHGGTDCKATSSHLFRKMRFMAVSGPTYDQQPVFKWSQQDFSKDTPHYGHPDEWKYPIVEYKWML